LSFFGTNITGGYRPQTPSTHNTDSDSF
jgi:hypothetical protein